MSEQAGESDYGYDLVHEEVPGAKPEPPEVGDLSYDLAHDVPPAEQR